MTELYPIYKGSVRIQPEYYIMIETVEIPEMYPEFIPPPEEGSIDDLYPEFINCAVDVFIIDTHTRQIGPCDVATMRNSYKYVFGRAERIAYWRTMKYLEDMKELESQAKGEK